MHNIRLSIIIPHYNSYDLLQKLIDSIPVNDEIQVILVDDNSTENAEEVKKFAESRQIEFYVNDSSKHSVGRCRNIGLEHAVGEWLLFADADDFFIEGFYDIIYPYFDKEYDIVYFAPTSIKLSDGTTGGRHFSTCNWIHNYCLSPTKENEALLRFQWDMAWSRIIHTRIVRENNFLFDETHVGEDAMFSMPLAIKAKHIWASEEVIYCITQQRGTLSRLSNREDVRTRLRINIKKYHYLKKHVDKDTWRILDLRGDRYIELITKYRKDKRDILWAWCYMLSRSVRPCFSRNVTIQNVIPKIIGKVFKGKNKNERSNN